MPRIPGADIDISLPAYSDRSSDGSASEDAASDGNGDHGVAQEDTTQEETKSQAKEDIGHKIRNNNVRNQDKGSEISANRCADTRQIHRSGSAYPLGHWCFGSS